MFALINIIRWIYHSEGNALHRVTFDGLENEVLVNQTANPIDIDIGMCSWRCQFMFGLCV